jgi:hypothetical protein
MLLSPAELAGILAEGRLMALTDQYAPVDQMLAPVFRGEEARPDGPKTSPTRVSPTPAP